METPRYEYSRSHIRERISLLKSLELPYGLTVRYAIKANPFPDIIRMMHEADIHFDASSSYEAADLLRLGVPGSHISLSSQQSPHNFDELLTRGVHFVATSLRQVRLFVDTRPGKNLAVRINADISSGHNKRTSTGGVNASFGIWHTYIPDVLEITRMGGVTVDRLHMHIGSGADPDVWGAVMDRALSIVELLPDVVSLDIGGGYKVKRYEGEREANMRTIAQLFAERISEFHDRTGRKIHVEIEPGTYFVAHAGTLVANIDDIVDTGPDGHVFLRLNTGMNDFLRTAIYGAQHRIEVVNDSTEMREYVVVGHNCESGDLFTPAPGNPEEIAPRLLREAHIGDEVRVYDTGAYGASMRTRGYNSYPDAVEIMVE